MKAINTLGQAPVKIVGFVVFASLLNPLYGDETGQDNTKVNERTLAHWAYVKPRRPEVPEVKDKGSARHPIDRFILAKLEASGIGPNPLASKEALLRRAYYDIVRLPPSPEQVTAFLADKSSAAFGKVIGELLASPQYGEKWGRHWLDVARFGESQGFERDKLRPNAWPYRDWVIHALNEDLPYEIGRAHV